MSLKDEICNATKKLILPLVVSIFLSVVISNDNNLRNDFRINVVGYSKENLLSEASAKNSNIGREVAGNNQYGILKKLVGVTDAYSVSFGGMKIGYIPLNEKINDILAKLTDIYIKKLGIAKEDVISADITCNIEAEEVITSISNVSNSMEIAEEIYNTADISSDNVNIDIKVKKKIKEYIEPEITTVKDDKLYLGETKTEIGELGEKEKLVEVTYNNGEVKDVNTLTESILKEAKDTVVREGSKNPYEDGVAFLSNPTSGGYMTSNYGPRWESFHKGIDIAGNTGDDVFAAMDGEVIYSQYNDGGYGNLVIIQHYENMLTYYAHLDQRYVTVGNKVNKGAVIGAVGNTGFSTGPHLHFELRVDGNHVNPTNYIIK